MEQVYRLIYYFYREKMFEFFQCMWVLWLYTMAYKIENHAKCDPSFEKWIFDAEKVHSSEIHHWITECTVWKNWWVICKVLGWNFKEKRDLLRKFKREILENPPYSLKLASIDYHLFTKIKDFLPKEHFKVIMT